MKTHEVAFSIASNNSPIVEVGRSEIRTRQETFPLEQTKYLFQALAVWCGKQFPTCEIFGCTDSRTRREVFFF